MDINIKIGTVEKEPAEVVVFYLYEDVKTLSESLGRCNKVLDNIVSEIIKEKGFVAKLNKTIILPTYGKIPARRIMLVGLGKKKDATLDKIRQAAGTAACTIRDMGISEGASVMDPIDIPFPISEWYQAYSEGALLALYRYQKYKTIPPEERQELRALTLLLSGKEDLRPVQEAVKHGQIIADAVCFTRDLINTPSQDKAPGVLADTAKKLGGEAGIQCKILSLPELKKLGMGGVLGVAQGSAQPPKFIILEYNAHAKNQDTVVFVGKGITFDSGGICLKQAKDMDIMKSDMAGGAAVMGAMKAISGMKFPQHVVGLIPCAENMPSGSAIKPGDIIRFYSGKTAEVANTDAEGRLILADALAYAEKYKPSAVIDLATLTGSCVVALGTVVTGMLGNNEELKKRVKIAGEKSWERVWELPLWEEYQEQIKSDIADIKNVGGPYAGAITAACFLSKFTEKYPWVHLDIAGTSWCEKNSAYTQKGASGIGVRLLVELIRNWNRFS
ncbi:MAG: leucyl aminopeptidase [Candidatus Brocadia sp. AMX2]|uniref:Probable cytosol aminopeptidase n=1 Tax=Candidatus Brocadia sinica JPN1 TaxID=1197129 RepID=A0ABQ0JVI3_9BACT|nr:MULTISPECIES: leucyl aminopeptidase [Brocadia]KXK30085.1 MAG: aminopeptidase [Candidatus Brocadia sinica]MBC6930842.1 leucyl aminopeptidase [Candidatus Brocadia sp.]MBL1167811.1 leucyl aminopeptidase [Candidatus Brocadia sp. AMX1]NOG41425.1 leucyl aminopeptidase [Planctomycetota bacterium]KAA0245520.1 MAG: leucyl aminopeptidase [Candidatus Brocadia sp. AMX2]